MYFIPQAHLVYLPLFAVAFILGIVAMAQGKAIGGQLVLVLSLIVPAVVGVRFLGMDLPEWAQIPGLTSPRPAPDESPPPEEAPSSPSEPVAPPTAAGTPATPPRSAPAGDWRPGTVDSAEAAPASDWSRPAEVETTDWEERLGYWHAQYAARFTPPAAGTRVTVTLLSGATNEGTLLNVEADQVTLQSPRDSSPSSATGWPNPPAGSSSGKTSPAFCPAAGATRARAQQLIPAAPPGRRPPAHPARGNAGRDFSDFF